MTDRANPQPSAPVTLCLFGSFQLLVDGQPVPQLHARKDQWLLALLTLAHGRPVQRIRLAQTLWPFPDTLESRASFYLRRSLCAVRRALGKHAHCLLCPTPQTLALNLDYVEADVLAFDKAVSAGDPSALAQAVSLYQGPLLSGCTESWVLPEREARQQQYQQALQSLAEGAMAGGDYAGAVGYLRQAVAVDPFWEEAQRALMQALAQEGDYNGALQVYQELVQRLGHQRMAAIPDPQTRALYHQIRTQARRRASTKQPAASERRGERGRTGHLPHPLTNLIGREEEICQLTARLQSARLVTLTGSGGVGKTRLALAVAEAVADEYVDGAWFVELAALSDGRLVAHTVASALGVREQPGRTWTQVLVDSLREKRRLLVLDNCEHLLDACAPFVEALLRECAGLRMLATSRQGLGLMGETVWRVPSLPAPDPSGLPVERAELVRVVSDYAAVQLFVERAEAVQKTFALTGENALAVAQVCSRLEGLPLALELAAAWVKVLPVEQIRDRLGDRLGLLTGGSRTALPHQQTLRATIEWSYKLLSPLEQRLLQRLSVFAGGWCLEAAEQVCAGESIEEWEVLDVLTGLVDKSLVVSETQADHSRYRLLETIREYAWERLTESEEEQEWRGRHLDYFLALAEEAEPQLRGSEQSEWLARLEAEHDNLRAALAWCQAEEDGAEAGLRLVGALSPFWEVRGYLGMGRAYLGETLARKGAVGRTVLRAKALNRAGGLARMQGDHSSARALHEESLSINRELGDKLGIADSLNGLGNVAYSQFDYSGARALYEQSLSIRRELGNKQGIAVSLNNLGLVAQQQDDYEAARVLYEESLAIKRELRDKRGIANSLNNLGDVAIREGEYSRARALYEQSLAIYRELGNKYGIANSLNNLGDVACGEGGYAMARTLYEESLAIKRELGEELGDKWGIAVSLHNLGNVAYRRGDSSSAGVLYEESLSIRRELGDKQGIAVSLEGFATLAVAEGQPERAVRLWGAAQALRLAIGCPMPHKDREKYDGKVVAVREALGEEAFEAAWAHGQAMTTEQITEYALQAERQEEKGCPAE